VLCFSTTVNNINVFPQVTALVPRPEPDERDDSRRSGLVQVEATYDFSAKGRLDSHDTGREGGCDPAGIARSLEAATVVRVGAVAGVRRRDRRRRRHRAYSVLAANGREAGLILLGIPGLLAVASPLPATLPSAAVAVILYIRAGKARPRATAWTLLRAVPACVVGALLAHAVGGPKQLVPLGIAFMSRDRFRRASRRSPPSLRSAAADGP
jgi:hypothetical protein